MHKPAGWTTKSTRPFVVECDAAPVRRKVELVEGADQTTFSRRALEWLQEVQNKGLSPGTIRKYGEVLRGFMTYADDRPITTSMVKEFVEDLIYEKKCCHQWCSLNTVVLKQFFRWCVTCGYAEGNPLDGLSFRFPPIRYRNETYSRAEYLKILEHAKGTDVYMPVILAYNTGMRIIDIMRLKWSDIDFKAQTITFFPVKTIRFNSSVTIPFASGSELCEALHQHRMLCPPDQEYVCQESSLDRAKHVLRGVLNRAGIPKSKLWHTFRRTFITNLLSSGVDHMMAMKLSGHRSVSSLTHYVAPQTPALLEAINSGSKYAQTKT